MKFKRKVFKIYCAFYFVFSLRYIAIDYAHLLFDEKNHKEIESIRKKYIFALKSDRFDVSSPVFFRFYRNARTTLLFRIFT